MFTGDVFPPWREGDVLTQHRCQMREIMVDDRCYRAQDSAHRTSCITPPVWFPLLKHSLAQCVVNAVSPLPFLYRNHALLVRRWPLL